MRRAGVAASSRCMMSRSRNSEALFCTIRLARLSPLVSTAPLSTNFSPGFSDNLSGIVESPAGTRPRSDRLRSLPVPTCGR